MMLLCRISYAVRVLLGWLVLPLSALLLPASAFAEPVNGVGDNDTIALPVMQRLYDGIESGMYSVESLDADLYVKERVYSERKNLLLNIIPDMTRFDRNENRYLAELFYKVHYIHNSLPDINRVAVLSTFRHASGEMDLVQSFMVPDVYSRYLFKAEHLSPLYESNSKYYTFETDTAYAPPGYTKINIKAKYRNVQLLSEGWIVVDDRDGMPITLYGKGWNEQCGFEIECHMGNEGLERALVKTIDLSVDYRFAFNRLRITAEAEFDYTRIQPFENSRELERKLNITPDRSGVADSLQNDWLSYASLHRKSQLSQEDSLFYCKKGVFPDENAEMVPVSASDDESRDSSLKNFLWQVGDGAISNHRLSWGSSDLRIYPLIRPSHLSYNSSRGVTYKFSMNFRTRFSDRCLLNIRPVLGYSFKLKECYWSIRGALDFMPMKRGSFSFDIGRGCSVYNNLMLDMINAVPADSLNIKEWPSLRYRDFHVKSNFNIEIANGLELQAGMNFYLRTMKKRLDEMEIGGVPYKKEYKQVAPHLRLTWHPGMYYYISEGKKFNLGSYKPRFSFDVEQGIKGFLGSVGEYTRAELDMQYKRRVSPGGSLYVRMSAGGYFHTDDIYFVNYTFLKDNQLPIDDDETFAGEFHLLDGAWYNSANKYARLNLSYESPFLLMQKLIPSAWFIKNESLHAGVLFISHLTPYSELGYSVDTPYINVGFFAGFEKASFHKIGVEVSFSLFRD